MFDQGQELEQLIEKLINYQKSLEEYKKQYHIFLMSWEKLVKTICEKQSKKLEELINNMYDYNYGVIKNSIIEYENINKKNKINYYNKENCEDLINEILSLERKNFNEKNIKEINSIIKPIEIVPSLDNIFLKKISIKKEDFFKPNFSIFSLKGYKSEIGDFKINYRLSHNNRYYIICKVDFPSNDDNKCYFFTQNNNNHDIIPMKLTEYKTKYTYECIINFEEFDESEQKEIKLGTKVTIFSM